MTLIAHVPRHQLQACSSACRPSLPRLQLATPPPMPDECLVQPGSLASTMLQGHRRMFAGGKQFAGLHGQPHPLPRTLGDPGVPDCSNDVSTGGGEQDLWDGFYTSPDLDVAAGYAIEQYTANGVEKTRAGRIMRCYLPGGTPTYM